MRTIKQPEVTGPPFTAGFSLPPPYLSPLAPVLCFLGGTDNQSLTKPGRELAVKWLSLGACLLVCVPAEAPGQWVMSYRHRWWASAGWLAG